MKRIIALILVFINLICIFSVTASADETSLVPIGSSFTPDYIEAAENISAIEFVRTGLWSAGEYGFSGSSSEAVSNIWWRKIIEGLEDMGYLSGGETSAEDDGFLVISSGKFGDDDIEEAYEQGLGSTPDYSGEAYLKFIDSTVENDSTVYRYQICNCLSKNSSYGTLTSGTTDGTYINVSQDDDLIGTTDIEKQLRFNYDFSNIVLPQASQYKLYLIIDEAQIEIIDDGYADCAYASIDASLKTILNTDVFPLEAQWVFINSSLQISDQNRFVRIQSHDPYTLRAHLELKIISPISTTNPVTINNYDSSTRIHDESLTYAYENSNNETSIVDDHSIVSETNNEWYNPVEDTTYNMDGWTYDYSTRTYNIDYTDGDGESQQAEVTYGSNNMTITSGGTTTTYSYVMSQDTYNNYYGSGSGSGGSSGGSGGGSGSGDGDDNDDDGGGLLDFLKALADVIGNILEFLLKPLELLLELIGQVIEKITDAFDISDEFIEAMTGLWGIFPAEITALIVAGLALIIVFAIIKIFLK